MAQVSTISTNKDNDIFIDGYNNIAMSEDIQAVSNIVLNKVRTNLGELQFNSNIGVPYFTTIFCSSPNFALWQKFVEDSALSLDNVTEIVQFETELNKNKLSYTMTIKTDFGSIAING
jgi:hypothetical protein